MRQQPLHRFSAVWWSLVLSMGFAVAAVQPQRTDTSLAASEVLKEMRAITDTPYSFDRAGKILGRTERDERRWQELAVNLSDLIVNATPSALDTQVLDEITAQFRDPYAWVSSDVLARSLGHIGPRAVSKLIETTRTSSDELVRQRVSEILTFAINYSNKQFDTALIDALVMLLDDPDTYVSTNAASALGSLGPRATRALPALERSLVAAEQKERLRATGGFVGILSSDVIRNVISAVKNEPVR
jgi:HEAT repeat protein